MAAYFFGGFSGTGALQNQIAYLGDVGFPITIAAGALAADIGIPTHLRDLGVPKEALEEMAVATMDINRILANNPKPLTLDDVRRIWQNAW